MKLVLLSGGSGKRLWPLSNHSRSKQFLTVLTNPEGQLESMVQRMWRQLGKNGLKESSFISTNRAQLDIIQSQLGVQVPLIIEPDQRDTFPAIALAAAYLNGHEGIGPDEVVTVMPVDPFVDDRFFDKVKALEDVIHRTNMEIALIGVRPSYPSTKYGYIMAKDSDDDTQLFQSVEAFKEKPTEEQARN